MTLCDNVKEISELGHCWNHRRTNSSILAGFLITSNDLQGLTNPTILTQMSIVELQGLDLRQNWFNLYELGRMAMKQNLKSEWTILLSVLGFRGLDDVNQLFLLQTVAVHRIFFQAQDPLNYELFSAPNNFFSDTVVKNILAKGVPRDSLDIVLSLAKVLWPVKSYSVSNFEGVTNPANEFSLIKVIDEINRHLPDWNKNSELKQFILKIEQTMAVLPASSSKGLNSSILQQVCLNYQNPSGFSL